MKRGGLLARQIKRALGAGDEAALAAVLARLKSAAPGPGPSDLSGAFNLLLQLVEESYGRLEAEKQSAERHVGSEPAQTSWRLKQEIESQKRIIESLQDSAGRLLSLTGAPADLIRVDGNRANLEAVSRLITHLVEDRAEFEQRLKQSEDRLNLAMEASEDGLWDWDLARNQVYFSPRWKAILGYSPYELENHADTWSSLLHPDDKEATQKRLAAHVSGQLEDYEAEFRMRTKDGGWKWIVSRGKVVQRDDQGRALRMVGTHRDNTERKRWEQELLRAKTAAEEASRAKSEFVANMSHEIRTPLNGIIGMTELALDTELTGEQRDYLRTVKTSSEALLTIINDILDFSKIEAGKLSLEDIPFPLITTLNETVKTLALRAHQRGLELICRIEPDVPAMVRGDPGRLRQVITNLVGNAIKFTERGEVEVGTEVDKEDGASLLLRCSVRDTGVGIPPEKHREIFSAFTQADNSTTREFGGTGLGLAICSRLVELMGGRIGLDSEPGQGSTFSFTVRVGRVPEQPQPSPGREAALHHLSGLRALVVDDNDTNRRVLRETLTRWGMRTLALGKGDVALSAILRARQQNDPFQVLLLDGVMPAPDGLAMASELRRSPDQPEKVLLMLHADRRQADNQRCTDLAVAARLVKPCSQSDLLDAIMLAVGAGGEAGEEGPGNEMPAVALRAEHLRRLNILLVEDNPVNQTLAQRLLEKAGHRITVASNGQEAVDHYERSRFDVILMDVQMPVMGGFEATRAIRTRENRRSVIFAQDWRPTPIIAMTAHAMQGDRERCLDAGMDDYLTKPISAAELHAALARVCAAATAADDRADFVGQNGDPLASLTPVRDMLEDEEAVRDLVETLEAGTTETFMELDRALAARDLVQLARIGHRVRGSVNIFQAGAATEAARRLENLAQAEGQGMAEAVRHLKQELARLNIYLREALR